MSNQSEHYPQQSDSNGTDNTEVKREPTILCRSQSCLQNAEEQSEKGIKAFNKAMLICMAVITAPIWFPVLKTLFDEYNRDPDLPSRGVMITLCILALAVFVLGRKAIAYIQNNMQVYRNHCSNETLIVDEEKVYGGNSKGKVSIPLIDISTVRYSAKTEAIAGEERLLYISNDIFEIRERSGKTHTFYTFTNCSELYSVIDMQIRRLSK